MQNFPHLFFLFIKDFSLFRYLRFSAIGYEEWAQFTG